MDRLTEKNIGRRTSGRPFVVLGIFRTRGELERGISTLQANGFQSNDVSAVVPWPESSHEFMHKAGTKAPEGVTTGAAAGAIAGGALGWLIGLGSIVIPGLGALLAAGPIVSALAGLGAGSAVGGIAGGLIGMGMPEYEAKRYEGHVKDGGLLLSVHCEDGEWRDRAKDIIKRCGAIDISSTHEARSERDVSVEEEPRRQVPPAASV